MPRWLVPIGRIFYAIGLIGIGVQHFIFADFISVILPSWPASIPGRVFLAYATGAALVAAGAAIIFSWRGRTVAAITGAVLLAFVVIAQVPAQMAANPGQQQNHASDAPHHGAAGRLIADERLVGPVLRIRHFRARAVG